MESRLELLPGVYLRAIRTDRFKTGCLNVNFVRPLTPEEAPLAALLPSVALRGTRRHPDIRSISAFLDEHYGASVGTLARKKGEILTTGFFADFPEEGLLPPSERVFGPVVDFLGELLFEPRLVDGRIPADVFEGEKRNLLDTIDWRLNDKRTYSVYRMIRVLHRTDSGKRPHTFVASCNESCNTASPGDSSSLNETPGFNRNPRSTAGAAIHASATSATAWLSGYIPPTSLWQPGNTISSACGPSIGSYPKKHRRSSRATACRA